MATAGEPPGPSPRLDRRRFLRYGGAAGAAVVLGPLASACGGPGRSPPSTSTSVPPGADPPWSSLAGSMSGRLVLPGDSAYGVAAQLYNERFDDARPAAIAFCADPVDVQRTLSFARTWGVPLAVRSGGHSYGGYSVGPGVVVGVTAMASVEVTGPAARVGAGTRLVDLYSTLASTGLTVPGGSCPTVGIAGLALGGGIGVLGRKFGLTADNLRSLQMVTPDSRLVTCSPTAHEDLFWASRGGGGGNFGVVTSFEFSVHPVPDVALFTLEWPWAAAPDVLGAWQLWIGQAPTELWSNCQLLSQGAAGPLVKVTGVFCGDAGALDAALAPLVRTAGSPSYRFAGPEAFPKAMLVEAGCEGLTVEQCRLPAQGPAGALERSRFAAKSLVVDEPLPSPAAAAVLAAVEGFQAQAPGLGGAVVFDACGGAIAEVPSAATAFVHRRALAIVQMAVSWSAPAPGPTPAGTAGWLAQLGADLAPHATGAYQNYVDPTLDDWATAYYGANLPRLRRIKRAVDPDDVFRFAQSIPPA
ncbi:MAG: FAD-binding oxidoreductase [Acidobacteriota bacterium]|nr:FAD-binding oxidoreductase [Acidobacteriota bacterium]